MFDSQFLHLLSIVIRHQKVTLHLFSQRKESLMVNIWVAIQSLGCFSVGRINEKGYITAIAMSFHRHKSITFDKGDSVPIMRYG